MKTNPSLTQKNKYIEPAKYLVVGLGAASTEFLSFVVLNHFIGLLFVANAASFFVGFIVSFLGSSTSLAYLYC